MRHFWVNFVLLQAAASLVVCWAAVATAAPPVEQVTQQSQDLDLETAESKPKRSIGGGKCNLYPLKI